MKSIVIVLCAMMITSVGTAQTFSPKEKKRPMGYDKKFIWGLSLSQYWSTIQGTQLAKEYFAKPSTGILVSAEYYPIKFIGIGLGVGYQQRGAGVLHHNQPPTGVDSAYRERLRFNTIEIPISISIRTPKDIIRGLRFGGSLALVPMINLHSHDVLNVVEPSLQDTDVVRDVSSSYFKSDMAYQFAVGPEIDYGSGIFKIHFVYSQGTANVYTAGQGTGHNQTLGFRLSAMF